MFSGKAASLFFGSDCSLPFTAPQCTNQ